MTALKRVGALVLGKTVTTGFAYFEPGPTRNPHNSAHTPEGSSSGSAAAVAAGFERAGWAGEKWVAIWFAVRGGMAAGRGVARLEQGAG